MPDGNKAWKIRGWSSKFETAQSRKVRNLTWVSLSNEMDNYPFVFLMDHPDGCAHVGVWDIMVRLASKCRPRGILVHTRCCPYDIDSISSVTRIPIKHLEEAIPRLIKIGWLEEVDLDTIEIPAERSRGSAGPHTPLDDRLVLVLEKLGLTPELRDSMHGKIRLAAGYFGGDVPLAEGLEEAFESGCTDFSSATAYLRKTGWRKASLLSKEDYNGTEIVAFTCNT